MENERRLNVRTVLTSSLVTLLLSLTPTFLSTSKVNADSISKKEKKELAKYRRKLFGTWPVVRDGYLERLDYREGDPKDHKIVMMGIPFFKGENRDLYDRVFGKEKGKREWEYDYNRAIIHYTNALFADNYDMHRDVRTTLKNAGILDFKKHQQDAQVTLDAVVQSSLSKDKKNAALDRIEDYVDSLRLLYLVTLPTHEKTSQKELDKRHKMILQSAFQALETSREAGYSVVHSFQFVGEVSDLYTQLLELERTAIADVKRIHAESKYEIINPFDDSKLVTVYDFIATEWNELNFGSWEKEMKEKINDAR